MGRRYWGGYWPERFASGKDPQTNRGKISGVFHVDEVRSFLDDQQYTSTIDSSRGTILPLNFGGYYSCARGWPKSLFNLTATWPKDATTQCNTEFIDFEVKPTLGEVDYGYGFKLYWEKQVPGTTDWVSISSPPELRTNKLRIGGALWNDNTADQAFGQYSTFRYSAINRYGTGTTITIPPTNNTADADTLALMLFNASTSGSTVGPVLTGPGRTAPTISLLSSPTLTTTNPPSGQQRSLLIGYNGVNLTADFFSRVDGDFTMEIYFLWTGNSPDSYYSSGIPFGNIIDTRLTAGGEKNPDALSIQIANDCLSVARGGTTVITDTVTFPKNTWYHIILTCENSVWRLYKRQIPVGAMLSNTASLVGAAYAGEHTPILRLRGNDLAVTENGAKYRALVKYGALREKLSEDATLTVVIPEVTAWDVEVDLILDGPGDVTNARHLLARDGTAYVDGAGNKVNIDVSVTANVSQNQFKFGWERTTQLLSDFTDGTGFYIGSPAAGGTGGYTPDQVYGWIDNEAASGLSAPDYWAGVTPTNSSVPAVPAFRWLPYDEGTASPPDFTPIFVGGNFLAFRPYVICGAQKIYGPITFIEYEG